MRIFGTLNIYGEIQQLPTLGVNMANYALMQALLNYGRFDEYHFFLPDKNYLSGFEQFCKELSLPLSKTSRIKAKLHAEIPEALAGNRYTVFHGWGPNLQNLSYLRESFAFENQFPISGMVHAISPPKSYSIITEILLASIQPYDVLICPSRALKTALEKYLEEVTLFLKERTETNLSYKGRLELIPLGVDTTRFRPRPKKALRAQLNLPQDKVIITCVTRLTPCNKMELFPLLRAFGKTFRAAHNKDILLLIIGKEQFKNYAACLEAFAREWGITKNVVIKKDFSNEDIPFYYSASDIFVSPSDNVQETFGLTPIEALASGLPAVISDWNGYKDLVTHNVTGFSIPTYWAPCTQEVELFSPLRDMRPTHLGMAQSVAVDIEKMAEYMIRLVDHPGLRKKMGGQAREAVLKEFDWRVIIPQIENLWLRLFESSQKAKRKESSFKRPFLRIPYFELFRHYPTTLLTKDTQIKISPFGEKYLRGEEKFATYEAISEFLDRNLRGSVLECTKDWVELEKVAASLVPKHKISYEKLLYQIMFMLKHNLLICKFSRKD